MDLDRIHVAIEEAVAVSVHSIDVHGIDNVAVKNLTIPSQRLQGVATRLEQNGHSEITLSVELELLLRVSNIDLFRSIQEATFRLKLDLNDQGLQCHASYEGNWAMAWEQGMVPLRESALALMKKDVWSMDSTLSEESCTFQAAMVLLASEMVGPYADRVAAFLRYPTAFVQTIAGRLYEAKIWEDDEVRCEKWFDPQKGGLAFLLDRMVAEGRLVRRWSEEKREFAYCAPEIRVVTKFAI